MNVVEVIPGEVDGASLANTWPDAAPANLSAPCVVRHGETGELLAVLARLPEEPLTRLRAALLAYEAKATTTYRSAGIKNRSRIFGYVGASVTMRRDGARLCTGAAEAPGPHTTITGMAATLADMFTDRAPAVAAAHAATVRAEVNDEWLLPGSWWTSGVVNFNSAMPYHRDGNNLPVWNAMVTIRRGMTGGELHFPELGLVAPCRDGDVIFMPAYACWHGVTHMAPKPGAVRPYRISAVYYSVSRLAGAGGAAEEVARAQASRTSREDTLLARQHITVTERTFNPDVRRDAQYAVVSHARPEACAAKTVAMLLKAGVDADRVTVFVTPGQEEAYAAAAPAGVTIRTGAAGLNAQHVAAHLAYPEGARLVRLDDDVTEVRRKVDDKTTEPVWDLDALVDEAFNVCESHGARLWGISAVLNPMFMRERWTVGLRFCIGHLWGCINSHDPARIAMTCGSKDDYQRCLTWHELDGSIVRADHVAAKTRMGAPGGIAASTPDRRSVNDADVEYLLGRWPRLVTRASRTSDIGAEIRLRVVTYAQIPCLR